MTRHLLAAGILLESIALALALNRWSRPGGIADLPCSERLCFTVLKEESSKTITVSIDPATASGYTIIVNPVAGTERILAPPRPQTETRTRIMPLLIR